MSLAEREREVVVTGYGILSPHALNAEESFERIVLGESGIVRSGSDLEGYPFYIPTIAPVKGFTQEGVMDISGLNKKQLRRVHLSGQFAIHAAAEALQRAGLAEEGSIVIKDEFQRSSVIGTAIGAGAAAGEMFYLIGEMIRDGRPDVVNALRDYLSQYSEEIGAEVAFSEQQELAIAKWLSKTEARLPTPPEALMEYPDRVASVPASVMKARGPVLSLVGACATASLNINAAAEKIGAERADIMITGGVEAQLTPEGLAGFYALTALDRSERPEDASRPFNDTENGFVPGQGAGILVLESREHAEARGATIYAVVAGRGESCDASDSDTLLNVDGSVRALNWALSDLSERAEDVYINMHATGTQGDKLELKVLDESDLDPSQVVGASSTKSQTAHGLGAAGGMEAIIAIMAMNRHQLPPTTKLESPVDGVERWKVVRNKSKRVERVGAAINHSFGFKGVNAVTIFTPA